MNAATISRILLGLGLIAAAFAIGRFGADAVPIWAIGLSASLGIDPAVGARILAGACFAMGGLSLALRASGRRPAMVFAALLALSGIADGSAMLSLGDDATTGLLRPILQFAVGGGCLVLLASGPAGESRPSTAGMVAAKVVLTLAVSAAVAAGTTVTMPESFRESIARGADGRFLVHDLTGSDWTGRALSETGLLEHLPAIEALSQGQPTLLAFYRPNCGMCHDLFDKHFGDRLPYRLVSIEVPPAEGVELAENNYPEDVTCPDCVRLTLPRGPVWVVTAPMLVEVVDGRVVCVSGDDFERCIDDAIVRAETAEAAPEAG